MQKVKKSDIEKLLDNRETDKILELVEFKTLNFEELAGIVIATENMVFNDTIYRPYLKEPAIILNYIKVASNIDMEDDDTPEGLQNSLSFAIKMRGVMQKILWDEENVYDMVYQGVEDAVAHRLKMIYSYSSWDSVGDLISELLVKVNDFAEKISEEGIGVKDIITSLAKMPNKEDIVKSIYNIIKGKPDKENSEQNDKK